MIRQRYLFLSEKVSKLVNENGSPKRNQSRSSGRKTYSVRGSGDAPRRDSANSKKSNTFSRGGKPRLSSDSPRPRSSGDSTRTSRSDSNNGSPRNRYSTDSRTKTNRERPDRSKDSKFGDRRRTSSDLTRKSDSNRERPDRSKDSKFGDRRRTSSVSIRRSSAASQTGALRHRAVSDEGSREKLEARKSSVRSNRPSYSRESTDREGSPSRARGNFKPAGDRQRERGGRDRDPDRPQKFDTPRRFRGDLPRRERDQRQRGNAPVIDDDVTGDELGEELNAELRSLPTGLTITVAQHLVMTQRYLEINPELALIHAKHAKELAGRFPLVREIVGVAQYLNGNWQEALNDFRAVKRMATAEHLVPLMADCERGLGRPEKAIAFLSENKNLTGVAKIEAAIVEAGARSDLGQTEAALVSLKIPALAGFAADPTAYARLCFAYASILIKLNRSDEAQIWFKKADQADPAATAAAEFLSDAQEAIYLDDLDAEN